MPRGMGFLLHGLSTGGTPLHAAAPSVSTGYHRKSCDSNVHGRVDVTVVVRPTIRAVPCAHVQRLAS